MRTIVPSTLAIDFGPATITACNFSLRVDAAVGSPFLAGPGLDACCRPASAGRANGSCCSFYPCENDDFGKPARTAAKPNENRARLIFPLRRPAGGGKGQPSASARLDGLPLCTSWL